MIQQCALTAKDTNSTLGCMNRIAGQLTEAVIILYFIFVRPHLEHIVKFWISTVLGSH